MARRAAQLERKPALRTRQGIMTVFTLLAYSFVAEG
jgi:hypothetical protein